MLSVASVKDNLPRASPIDISPSCVAFNACPTLSADVNTASTNGNVNPRGLLPRDKSSVVLPISAKIPLTPLLAARANNLYKLSSPSRFSHSDQVNSGGLRPVNSSLNSVIASPPKNTPNNDINNGRKLPSLAGRITNLSKLLNCSIFHLASEKNGDTCPCNVKVGCPRKS